MLDEKELELKNQLLGRSIVIYDKNEDKYYITIRYCDDCNTYLSIKPCGEVTKDKDFMVYNYKYMTNIRKNHPEFLIICENNSEKDELLLLTAKINIEIFNSIRNSKSMKKYFDRMQELSKNHIRVYNKDSH